jgi:hypothetical protein
MQLPADPVAAVFGTWWARGPPESPPRPVVPEGGAAAAAAAFAAARPFPWLTIDGFFAEETAAELEALYAPAAAGDLSGWHAYRNPIEIKYAHASMESLPAAARVFAALQSEAFVARMRALTGIADLEADPHLHGAGLHFHPRGGKLDMHLDYSIHPLTGRERRLNLIVYLNRRWEPGWGGAIELWDESCARCEASVLPAWNRAVLFRTSDISYHGLPRPIRCPPGDGRRSLAVYYVSPPRAEEAVIAARPKAEFRPLPGQPLPPGLAALYAIRARRRITEADLAEHYPGWGRDEAGRGYWWIGDE